MRAEKVVQRAIVKKKRKNKNKKGKAGGKVEHEEIQVGWCLESETVHSSHWQVFFLTFPKLFPFSHFFFPLAHLFYAKRFICLSWLICSASGFRHPGKSVLLKTVI